jgi:type 1 glutamine amidotransferase
MKVLVLCGDTWHPPDVARQGLEALAGSEFVFDWVEDAGAWTPDIMQAYPLVILTKSNNVSASDSSGWMTEAVEATFLDYVHQGNGLLVIHSGTAEYDQKPVLRRLLGGVFSHHPEQCPVTISPRLDHPLCSGSEPFTARDEHYFMTLDDLQAEIFMTTLSAHGEQPGAWRRTDGSGRVAVLTPGHNLEVWVHPSYQVLIHNCLLWCGGSAERTET